MPVAPLRLEYIPSVLFVHGNAALTAQNIASHQGLFRAGIYADLLAAVITLFVTLALYRLLSPVDRNLAIVMVLLGSILSVPIYFMNTVNDAGALLFASGAPYLSVFSAAQRDAVALVFVNLHHFGVVIMEMFWGLWLLPFGALVYKSEFLPRFLGVWLILNGFAYIAQNFTGVLFPQYEGAVSNVAFPLELGEIAVMLWLIVMGAKKPRIATPAMSS